MPDFLLTEYEQCLALLKYYEERQLSLIKFAAGISTGAASALVALQRLEGPKAPFDWNLVPVFSIAAALSMATIFVAMIQNRLYFVFPARQVNALRRALLETVRDHFTDNQMYVTTAVPAFKWRSAMTLMSFLVAMQIGLFIGLLAYSGAGRHLSGVYGVGITIGAAGAGIAAAMIWAVRYLTQNGGFDADHAVHGRRKGKT